MHPGHGGRLGVRCIQCDESGGGTPQTLTPYLQPTPFVDSDHPRVIEFAQTAAAGDTSDIGRARALFVAVRDSIRYDPYRIELTPAGMKASAVLQAGYGFCVAKAVVLAAAARAVGIPSRLGFGDVRNHLTTERLRRAMRGDVFVYHGYTELLLEGKWVKATPAFNRSLCDRFNVAPLEFDGRQDALFQEFDRDGRRYMEYVGDRGRFADLPLAEITAAFAEHYPLDSIRPSLGDSGRFEDEALPPDRDRQGVL